MITGIIIVDHGSRRTESNAMLERVAALFAERFASTCGIVEPAHMELAEPSIATAYAACARRGATHVIVAPFFLGPGKHWNNDIPRLTAEAAAGFPNTRYHVTQTLGIDDLILDLLHKRVSHCTGSGLVCEICRGTIRSGEPGLAVEAAAGSNGHAAAHAPTVNGQPAVCSSCPYQAAIDAGATLIEQVRR
jgi:sirohydrochlorin ferrochelatase